MASKARVALFLTTLSFISVFAVDSGKKAMEVLGLEEGKAELPGANVSLPRVFVCLTNSLGLLI